VSEPDMHSCPATVAIAAVLRFFTNGHGFFEPVS
jgi:hypothetical protein